MTTRHVPTSFPAGTSGAEAFASYLALPPSLAKVRHEEEAYLAAAPWTHTLKQRGYQVVRSCAPDLADLRHL